MAAATSNSLNDLATAFLIQALGLNPLLSPVLNSAGLPPAIAGMTDVTATGTISALNANLATGVPTALSTVTLPGPLIGLGNLSIQVQGAFVGTMVVQVSNDNINWTSVVGSNLYLLSGAGTGITGPGIYITNTGSFAYVRVTCSAYTSGAPTVLLKISDTNTLVALGGGVANLGQVGLNATTAGSAATQAKILTAATTNATSVKASSGKLFSYIFSNNTAAVKFVHFHNKASAPTVGTDVPAFTVTVPASATINFHSDLGLAFTTGLAYSITGAAGDLDATVTAVNDVSGVLGYI